jgi:hypothetical protein
MVRELGLGGDLLGLGGAYWEGGGACWEGGVGPCTTPLLWLPLQIPYEIPSFLHISLRFKYFFPNFFVPQAQVELFVLTVGIFIS